MKRNECLSIGTVLSHPLCVLCRLYWVWNTSLKVQYILADLGRFATDVARMSLLASRVPLNGLNVSILKSDTEEQRRLAYRHCGTAAPPIAT
jgi:hypothetical protein